MRGTLKLQITMGNDAMSDLIDVGTALRKVAIRIEDGTAEGIIRDLNGGTVGEWALVPEPVPVSTYGSRAALLAETEGTLVKGDLRVNEIDDPSALSAWDGTEWMPVGPR